MIPSYSESAKAAIPVLMNSAYSAFLFFEDSGAEIFYEEIVKKLLPNPRNVRIICLSGKESLINHCNDPNNKSTKKKSLYILDKDFDDLLNKRIQDNCLFYLEKYSIENFILEESAVLLVIQEEKPRLQNVVESLDWNGFFNLNLPFLLELSSLYLISQKFSLGITSCSEPIQRYTVDGQSWLLCAKKISRYREDIEALLLLNGFVSTEAEIQDILTDGRQQISDLANVPGKQIVDLSRLYIGNRFELRGLSRESFCYRLAKSCSFNSLRSLRDRVSNLV